MSSPKGLTKEVVKAALLANGGLQTQAAMVLGVTPAAICKWVKKHPDLAADRKTALDHLKNVAEGHLFKAVMAGDMKWIRYFLDAHARDRGYGNRMQLTGKDDAPLFDVAGLAQFVAGLTDDERAAFETLRSARPDGVASVGEPTLQ